MEKVAVQPQQGVLVVVPDPELRRSVEFALEAEGFHVDSYALLTAALRSGGVEHCACAIVDENAVSERSGIGNRLELIPQPVILLVDTLRSVPQTPHVTILTKPLLGRGLVDTVVALVGEPPTPGLRSSP
ncbi:MAG: transcriptional regulator [Aquamicrobium sp.]|nr:transcriptional regulator [Aquamicrobium sp.]